MVLLRTERVAEMNGMTPPVTGGTKRRFASGDRGSQRGVVAGADNKGLIIAREGLRAEIDRNRRRHGYEEQYAR